MMPTHLRFHSSIKFGIVACLIFSLSACGNADSQKKSVDLAADETPVQTPEEKYKQNATTADELIKNRKFDEAKRLCSENLKMAEDFKNNQCIAESALRLAYVHSMLHEKAEQVPAYAKAVAAAGAMPGGETRISLLRQSCDGYRDILNTLTESLAVESAMADVEDKQASVERQLEKMNQEETDKTAVIRGKTFYGMGNGGSFMYFKPDGESVDINPDQDPYTEQATPKNRFLASYHCDRNTIIITDKATKSELGRYTVSNFSDEHPPYLCLASKSDKLPEFASTAPFGPGMLRDWITKDRESMRRKL